MILVIIVIFIAMNLFWLIENVKSKSFSKLQIILWTLWVFILVKCFVEAAISNYA